MHPPDNIPTTYSMQEAHGIEVGEHVKARFDVAGDRVRRDCVVASITRLYHEHPDPGFDGVKGETYFVVRDSAKLRLVHERDVMHIPGGE